MRPEEISPSLLAAALNVTEAELYYLARNPDRMFLPTQQRPIKGKLRDIDAPLRTYLPFLRKLHRLVQREIKAHPAVHGGAKGKSCFSGARKHVARDYIVTRDIQDCFPSITREMLFQKLRARGFRNGMAEMLSRFFAPRGYLPQGSPLSGDALNILMYNTDERLTRQGARMGFRYHRTYDDLVTSTNSKSTSDMVGNLIEEEIAKLTLIVSEKKKAKNGLQTSDGEQRVHNLDVSNALGVATPPEQNMIAIRIANEYVRGCKVASPRSLEKLSHKRQQIFGYLCHFRQGEYSPARMINHLLAVGDRAVLKKLVAAKIYPRKGQWWVISNGRNDPKRLSEIWLKHKHAEADAV